MENIELLAQKYNDLIAVLSMLGTWAAVLVALWLANNTRKPRISVFVDKRLYIPSEAQNGDFVDKDLCDDIIAVTMKNRGSVTVYINYWSFVWKLPKLWRINVQQNPYSPDFRYEDIKIESFQSKSIIIDNSIEQHKEMLINLCKKNKVPYFMRRFIRLYVYSSDGACFVGKFGKIL